MFARMHKAQEGREAGFTLIELLVVMIIIGILAAIAIPAFLAQRTKSYEAAVKNDLKNAAIAEETYATDYQGNYVSESVNGKGTAGNPLELEGYSGTTTVNIVSTATNTAGAQKYIITGSNVNGGATFCINSSVGQQVVKGSTC